MQLAETIRHIPHLSPPCFLRHERALQEVKVLGPRESWALQVAGSGGHDIVTITPVARCSEVEVAPVGLINMLNAGGSVREFRLYEERGAGGCAAFWCCDVRSLWGIPGVHAIATDTKQWLQQCLSAMEELSPSRSMQHDGRTTARWSFPSLRHAASKVPIAPVA
jgi:hypothetical protein